jgi:hypothetical protein
MANTYSAKGTSYPSFQVGKKGITLYQGAATPSNSLGIDGDMYVQSGASTALWQRVNGAWAKIGSFASKIFAGTTAVDTSEVANHITLTAAGKRVVEVQADPASVNGEKIAISNGSANIGLSISDTSGTNPVDLVVNLQSTGALKIQSAADSAIRSSAGSPITVQPGASTTGVGGNVVLRGGTSTAAGFGGGNVQLIPGTGGSGATAAQVTVPTTYVAVADNSVVARIDQANLLTYSVTTETSHAVAANEQLILVNKTTGSATGISLPTTAITGRVVRIKDAKGDAATNNITVSVTGGATIEGQASVVINTNFGHASFVWSGSAWFLI